ncbi:MULTISPECIES: hypothetical protein [unclassified Curtobacterium]|uniref:hypothetical protein n=1 Tax=unclassified Curtobacterium TaxID=257496 RepID=UPI00052A14C6|nr:hypothetical protein [Curtobacterium sp. MR_MD2014]AIV40007.1 hypothetical protein NI26_06965 [Curtobacterium sp. MR_MD2014]
MHDDTTTTPLPAVEPEPTDDATTDPLGDRTPQRPLRQAAPQRPVAGAVRTARTLCMSVFDRWRCGLEDGHGGLHTATEVGATTSWNDAVAGRMLREL